MPRWRRMCVSRASSGISPHIHTMNSEWITLRVFQEDEKVKSRVAEKILVNTNEALRS